MAIIEWRDAFNTGVPAIDHEHRELVRLINRLYADLIEKRDSPQASFFFGELYGAISAHFALEERFMREGRYAGFAAHKDDHERLLDEIRDLMDEYETGGGDDFKRHLAKRLSDWFTVHFQAQDAKLHGAIGYPSPR
ncbi:MAG: bacteriohemerythrin [Alphaproteobacteria bacterium]|nr:bacteriohemerythrin [Alphaproteobacteria bacterium]